MAGVGFASFLPGVRLFASLLAGVGLTSNLEGVGLASNFAGVRLDYSVLAGVGLASLFFKVFSTEVFEGVILKSDGLDGDILCLISDFVVDFGFTSLFFALNFFAELLGAGERPLTFSSSFISISSSLRSDVKKPIVCLGTFTGLSTLVTKIVGYEIAFCISSSTTISKSGFAIISSSAPLNSIETSDLYSTSAAGETSSTFSRCIFDVCLIAEPLLLTDDLAESLSRFADVFLAVCFTFVFGVYL